MEKQPNTHNDQEGHAKNDATLLEDLQTVLLRAYEKAENRKVLMSSRFDFAQSLQEKYPDTFSRRLWHLLIGSSPPPEIEKNMSMADYPGEDSIVRFIEGLDPEKKG
jgi:hypothetical protein